MTFKEQLSLKAAKISIKDDIEYIKKKMEDFYARREFTVNLIRPKVNHIAIGGASSNFTQLFIPREVSPQVYRQVFVEAFKELGFTDDDIILEKKSNEWLDSYNIILKG